LRQISNSNVALRLARVPLRGRHDDLSDLILVYTINVGRQFRCGQNERNIASHGISFEAAEQFEWDTAMIAEDLRKEYGERRFQALGFIAGRLHAMVFTPRAGTVHVISLRKANRREMKRYEAQA
jgi:uncharacterized DUF497 family protein